MPKPWRNGNEYKSFVELMSLVKINDGTFESSSPAFSPDGNVRAFGGHVYAQAAWAASHTVKKDFVLHSVTGWFTLQGDTARPFVYRVNVVRDGGGYCQRQVNVTQDANKGVCFTCICSFKRPEVSVGDRQLTVDLREQYDVVLRDKKPEDWPECPGVDSPFWWEVERKRGWVEPFPGLAMRKVDMTAYNTPRPTLERRQLHFYKVIGAMPSVADSANLHACAHLYASDRNGLFNIPNFLDLGDNYDAIASLSHTVIFHVEADGLRMTAADGTAPWFCHEISIDKIAHGRALEVSRLWGEHGLHIASCFQDGLLRMPDAASDSRAERLKSKATRMVFGKAVERKGKL